MRLSIESDVVPFLVMQDPVADHAADSEQANTKKCLNQGIAAAQSGDRALARTLLSNVTEADPHNIDAWLWLASISEYPEELLGFLSRVLEIDPSNERACEWEAATRSLLAKTFVQRGITADSHGHAEVAIQCFDKALEYDVRCTSAWLWKSSLADNDQDRESYLTQLLEIDPENEEAKKAMNLIDDGKIETKLNAARIAAFAGNFLGADEFVSQVLDRAPDNSDAWCLRSQIVFSLDEKLEAYRRISMIDPDNVLARSGFEYLSKAKEQAVSAAAPARMVKPDLAEDHGHNDPEPEPIPQMAIEPATEAPNGNGPVQDQVPLHELFTLRYNAELGERATDENLHQFLTEDSFAVPAEFAEEIPATGVESKIDTVHSANDEGFSAAAHIDEEVEQEQRDALGFATHETVPANSGYDEPMAFDDVNAALAAFDPFQSKAEEVSTQDDDLSIDAVPAVHSEPIEEVAAAPDLAAQFDLAENTGQLSTNACPFCGNKNEAQVFSCSSCHAVLSLSDLDSLFGDSASDKAVIQNAVTQMEAEWNNREFSESELTTLGLGHFNLKNYDKGSSYLQEASRLDPNNVILAGQVNAIAIRLEEIRRQDEYHDTLPKGKTILVVDDSATVRKLISSKLEKCGHHVLTAVDGVEAMEVIESVVPDLVLLDITMPRMDGYSVCKLIRAKESVKNVPVVMISGKDGFFDKVRGRMAGTTGYITKPFGPETLMRALETYLLPDEVEV